MSESGCFLILLFAAVSSPFSPGLTTGLGVAAVDEVPGQIDAPVDYNRQIRPLLAEHCWQCHGPDAGSRKAGLRLDRSDSATTAADSGAIPIVPGQPAASELVRRMTAADPDLQMPPPDFGKPLAESQKLLLARWIGEGAAYQPHWSFVPPEKGHRPPVSGDTHFIDARVRSRLAEQNLRPSPRAAPETLIRRVYLDLIGLPPTPDELQQALQDGYSPTVDRLLESPHFGEHMAAAWLDAARYADTNGYFSDKPRTMWLYRDWVINAFNSNMPFDQFTIEQLAGDLLPDRTIAQRIASGFNRNHPANNETGIIDEEFRTEYVADRVDTTMTTWTGLTVACAQCHDHKYDPISQREYYQLFAIFNNGPETGLIVTDNPPPVITVTSPYQDQRLSELTAAARQAADDYQKHDAVLHQQLSDWESTAREQLPQPPSLAVHEETLNSPDAVQGSRGTSLDFETGTHGQAVRFDGTQHLEVRLDTFDADQSWTIGFWMLPDSALGCPVSRIEPEGRRRGWEILCHKSRLMVNLVSEWGVNALEAVTAQPVAPGRWHHIVVTKSGRADATSLTVFVDRLPVELQFRRQSLSGSLQSDEPLRIARRDEGLGYYGLLDEVRFLDSATPADAVADWFFADRIRGALARAAAERAGHHAEAVIDYFVHAVADPSIRDARQRMLNARIAEAAFRQSLPTALVMEEQPVPRDTRVLIRGQYDHPGEAVSAGVPEALGTWPADAPRNRLGLAMWLVSERHPLTARVAVNRLWKQCFGEGLVRTPGDFGNQGQPPEHQDLLDDLAVAFQASGWNVKALLRMIVTSETYQQSSVTEHRPGPVVDPQNRWLSRGPRYRLSAETIRDQALTVSGLLSRTVGGPSVKPWQPPGLWEEVSYNGEDSYEPDHGENARRRSLYTFIKRQAPPPALLLFDGTTREKCTVQRASTNTPLQALALLNDPVMLQAAFALVQGLPDRERDERVAILFRRVLIRNPGTAEVSTLSVHLERTLLHFQARPEAARRLVSALAENLQDAPATAVGTAEGNVRSEPETISLAAWTVIAHTLLNLDEAVTRP